MAAVLLGEFLHLCHLLLPPELNLTGHCLPSLLQEVASTDSLKYDQDKKNLRLGIIPTSFHIGRSNRASEAVNALHTLHSMKMSGPEAHSLFLEQILQESGCFQVSNDTKIKFMKDFKMACRFEAGKESSPRSLRYFFRMSALPETKCNWTGKSYTSTAAPSLPQVPTTKTRRR